MNPFIKTAIQEAYKALKQNSGGPFGAIIVKNKKIIVRAHNEVIKTNDPTAHAEILALRKAAAKLRRFDLSDCVVYSSCEPCPMCLAAIHWAKIKKLYYGCTKQDAAAIGFDDKFIYDVIKDVSSKKQVKMIQTNRKNCLKPFQKWELKQDKVQY